MIQYNDVEWSGGFGPGFGTPEIYTSLGIFGLPQVPYELPVTPLAKLGGTYNAAEYFPTGSNVTISLYDPVSGVPIAVKSDICNEVPSTGLYVWSSSDLVTQPTGYKEYLWVMTDGSTIKGGTIRMFDAEDSARLIRVEELLRNRHVTDPSTGKRTIYADDGVTPKYQGDLWENAAGTQPYRGNGAESSDRLDDV